MATNHYLPGQAVRVYANVESFGSFVDPSTIQAQTKDPNGTVTTYASPTRDGVGQYHQDFTLANTAASGTWLVKWVTAGSSANQNGVVFDSFDVDALMF